MTETNKTSFTVDDTFGLDSDYLAHDEFYSYISTMYDESEYADDNRFYYVGDLSRLRKPWLEEADYIPTVIMYGIAFIVGVIGNGLVICAIVGDIKHRTNTTIFLLSLATSDVLFLVVCVPYELSRHFIDHWQLGSFLCKYVAIVHPMRSRYYCTFGNMRRIIPLVWLLATLLSSPAFIIMSTELSVFYNNQSSVDMIFCSDHGVADNYRLAFACYQFLIMFMAPTIIMIVCYSRVIHVLWVFVDWLPYIQACINPIFYCFMSRKFRRSVRVMFARSSRRSLPESANGFQTVTSSSDP
ncbi:GALR2-like protein, partial [Mya arenaria]